ncbi:SpoIIE family protein phosphatase, partial [bacterium AH-315-M05]|nr:SpoIIE family protein phosphatase [bacterium AH-315-M05]
EIVNDRSVTDAAEVLNQLRDGVIHAFGEAGATGEAKDGMDMALCAFQQDDDNGIVNLQYAGAYNPLYLIREGSPCGIPTKVGSEAIPQGKLQQIKADKQSVGYHYGEQKSFTNHETQLQKGDTIYIFSDGYQDQFGGPRGKKFMSKQFRQLFLDIQGMSMEEQKEHLDKTIEEWKGSKEQVDDILVIGVQV